jgi:hypothetical protein
MEVSFEPDVYLLLKTKAKSLKKAEQQPELELQFQGFLTPDIPVSPQPSLGNTPSLETSATPSEKNINITGKIPPDSWNRIGTKIIPKLRNGNNLQINVAISFSVNTSYAQSIESDIDQIIDDIGLSDDLKIMK